MIQEFIHMSYYRFSDLRYWGLSMKCNLVCTNEIIKNKEPFSLFSFDLTFKSFSVVSDSIECYSL